MGRCALTPVSLRAGPQDPRLSPIAGAGPAAGESIWSVPGHAQGQNTCRSTCPVCGRGSGLLYRRGKQSLFLNAMYTVAPLSKRRYESNRISTWTEIFSRQTV